MFKRKNVIVCYSEEEMYRKADGLIERGYHVETAAGVMPVAYCMPTYKVVYWS